MNYKLVAYGINGAKNKIVSANIIRYDIRFGLPVLDIPMMSDERWNELTKK